MNAVPSSDLSDVLWVDLMPWLDDYVSDRAALLEPLAPGEDWWLADSPSVTAAEVDLDKVLSELAELFVASHKQMTFAQCVPTLSVDLPAVVLGLEARAATTLKRLTNDVVLGGLLVHTATDLFAIAGTSEHTVRDVVHALMACVVLADPRSRLDGEVELPDQAPVITQLLDDLSALAAWRRIRGQRDRPLVTVDIDDDSPEAIQDVAARIAALTPMDLPDEGSGDAVDQIEDLVAQLDGRESIALHERLLAAEPLSLGALSTRLHLSKPAAGTIESKVKARINAACGYGTAVGNLLASLRVEIQPVASMGRLLELHPELGAEVPGLNVPLWLVLDRLDDYFDVTDGWAAAPDVAAAKKRTQSILEDLESPNGVVPVDELESVVSMPRSELEKWLDWCGIPVVEGSAITRVEKVGEAAVAVLEALGRSTSAADVAQLVGGGKSGQAVHRLLEADDRVALGVDGLWGLTAWADAGQAGVETPTDTFEADHDGTVRRRRSQRGAKSPEQTRRLYRIGLAWRYRIVVTADQLRGSGFALPAGVATAVGCERGETVELTSRLGTQMVRWTGAQPTSGTIRRFLRELGVSVGDDVLLVFSPDRSFAVVTPETLPDDADPLRRALAAIGHPQPSSIAERHLVRVLADAIGLAGESRPRRLLSAYETSSEDHVVELLQEAWVHRTVSDD